MTSQGVTASGATAQELLADLQRMHDDGRANRILTSTDIPGYTMGAFEIPVESITPGAKIPQQ